MYNSTLGDGQIQYRKSFIMGKGGKCHICTGCGRCDDTGKKTSIIADMPLAPKNMALTNARGIRLVTVDMGTTTIAMQLHGTDGRVTKSFVRVNPQVRYGADVISRICAAANSCNAIEEEQENVAVWMRQSVKNILELGLAEFRQCLETGESMYIVIAANTTMSYLFMGWNPAELGCAPFCATHLQGGRIEIAGVSGTLLPGFSAFVGGDIRAGILACGMAEQEKVTLLIDLGTNGELVLGNKERRVACATAAGPAFEGGVNKGVWGADMVSLLAKLRRRNLVDETGLLADAYFDAGVKIEGVCVTQQAVRAIQLAKAAIMAGIRILMRIYGISVEGIDRVVLAGGFGYYLKPEDAAVIGLLPQELVRKTVSGGNTALAGALLWGMEKLADGKLGKESKDDNKGCNDLPEEWTESTGALQVEVLNLAEEPDFEELYLASMELRQYTL